MAYAPSYTHGDDLMIMRQRHDAVDVVAYYSERYAFRRSNYGKPAFNVNFWSWREARYTFEREQEIRANFGLPPLRDAEAEAEAAHMARVIAEDEAMEKRFGREAIERMETAWELHREENGFRVHV